MVSVALADVKLPGVFGDQMVLQRDRELPVWGSAAPGEKVTVSMAGQTLSTVAGNDGRWLVRLKAIPAGGPHQLVVRGRNAIELADVLVGEVWLCSGQSNMAMAVSGVVNAPEEIARGDHPKLRMLNVQRQAAADPQDDCHGDWQAASPATLGGFSATAYFFGRELHRQLQAPVGLINASWGGTAIEAWTSIDAQTALPELKPVLEPWKTMAAEYDPQLATLITDWRARFGQGDFPFLFVQLPNFTAPQEAPSETGGWVMVREGMFKTLALAGTGMAVTLDIGDANNIHPKNKQEVGRRLALWALGTAYGRKIVFSGPLYRTMRKQADRIVLEFDHVGDGLLATGDGPLVGFAIAGADRKFVRADAQIDGATVVVSSPEVPQPAAVRYAWAANPQANLANRAGLPASPFRTDDWVEPIEGR
jgi:sialate O-acetylesterase